MKFLATTGTSLASRVFFPLLEFIYPPVCFTCDRRLTARDSKICVDCWKSVHPIGILDPAWRELTARLEKEGVTGGMLSCYVFEHGGTLQEIIHLLKYGGVKAIGRELGIKIGERIASDDLFRMADYSLPVPLHRVRLRERGYNQCAFLCEGITAVTGIPSRADLLMRTRSTMTQTRLTPGERIKNVEGAFSLSGDARQDVDGKTIILVDDVITTGCTVAACARELRRGGAKTVLVASAAIAK